MKTDLFKLAKEIYLNNAEKGFWDNRKRDCFSLRQALGLIQSEFFEAFEALRKNKFCNVSTIATGAAFDVAQFTNEVKDTYEDELSDVEIRVLDLIGGYGMKEKQFNDTYHYWQMFLFYQNEDKLQTFSDSQPIEYILKDCKNYYDPLFSVVCSSVINECFFVNESLFERFMNLFKPSKSEFEKLLNKSFHILVLILVIIEDFRGREGDHTKRQLNWKLQYNKTRQKMHGKSF